MIDKEKIKAGLPMQKLLEHYSAARTAHNQYWCIMHEKGGGKSGHKTPSLVLNPKHDTISCMSQGCFKSNDIFGVIAKMENLDIKTDFPKVCEFAALLAGVDIGSAIKKTARTTTHVSLSADHVAYLKTRGFTQASVGQMDLASSYRGDYILFLYRKNGEVVGCKGKSALPKEKRGKRDMFFQGEKPGHWPHSELGGKKIIYLTAGEYDTAILEQELKRAGLDGTIAAITLLTGEASPVPQSMAEDFKTLSNVEWRIVYDDDKTGRDNMPRRARELAATGKKISIFAWKPEMNPEKKDGYDINDHFLRTGSVDIFLDAQNFQEIKHEETVPASSFDRSTSDEEKKLTMADMLVHLITRNPSALLFRSELDEPFVQLPVGDHKEHWPCKSKQTKLWLAREFWKKYKKAPNSDALGSALNVLEGTALYEGEQFRLSNRVAMRDEVLFYSLANTKWEIVRITPDGWSVMPDTPILFRKQTHQEPQLIGTEPRDLREIFKYVNIEREDHKLLFLVVLITNFIEGIPHPMLYLHGPQGSAKTTASKIARRLVDPSKFEVAEFPKDMRELVQQISHHWFLIFDNVSHIPSELSDLLCRAITGAGFSKRELWSDDSDIIYSFKRPLGMSSVSLPHLKPDLLDRSILIELARIPSEHRKQEQQMLDQFEQERPSFVASIFNTLAKALSIRTQISPSDLPRMADFAAWGCAVSEALGYPKDDFLKAYRENIGLQHEEVINSSLEATFVVEFMANKPEWTGSATELLRELQSKYFDFKNVYLPKSASALSRSLLELKTTLAEVGIDMNRIEGKERKIILINKLYKDTENAAPAASSLLVETKTDTSPAALGF
jgi:hypothetical protein